jgi:SAM-dependent methyltransferase
MWRIETSVEDAGAPYDRRAVAFDHLVRSRTYNRLAWSTSPGDYAHFAEMAFASSDGPLLEVAAGSAAATAELHARAARPTILLDLSRPMLDRAAQRITAACGGRTLPEHVRLLQADLFAIPPEAGDATTILGLGLTHLFDDVPGLVAALRTALRPGGRLWLSGLVAETRRGRRYLALLHRAGEVGVPRTAAELRAALGRPAEFSTKGCMAYATLDG